jgi:hypothetical protein
MSDVPLLPSDPNQGTGGPALPALLRQFRRQFLILRKTFPDGNLSVQIDSSPQKAGSKLSLPPGAFEYASVLRPFADRGSPLYLPKFWQLVRTNPSLDTALVASIDQQLARIRSGTGMLLKVNNRRLDHEAAYHLVADGELFGENPREAEALKAFHIGPALPLLRFAAFNYMHDLGMLLPFVYEALGPLLASNSSAALAGPRCIYCLSTSGPFKSEDHALAESLAGETLVLPRGAVCDTCNHGPLAVVDKLLVDFPPVSFLRVLFLPHTKGGKYPVARFPSFRLEKTGPRSIRIRVFGRDPRNVTPGGMLTMTWKGKRLDLRGFGRSLMRVGLGVLANDFGYERVYSSDFDAARAFIRGERQEFQGRLLLDTSPTPHPAIELRVLDGPTQSVLIGKLFGIEFAISLREAPMPELPASMPSSVIAADLGTAGKE